MESRPGIAAAVLGLSAWAQIVLLPWLARAPDVPTRVTGLFALGLLIAAVLLRTRGSLSVLLGLGAFPFALGVFAFALGRGTAPRYDTAAGVFAGITTAGYASAAVSWVLASRPVYPVTVTSLDDGAVPALPAPVLRRVSLGVLTTMALFSAVVAPGILAARDTAEMINGLARGRHALAYAGGLAIAMSLILGGGSSVVHTARVRDRSPGRALGYLAWAALAYAMRRVLTGAR